ncbi:UPF0606 protein KIAA1549 [Trichomycterus rosablanca]|uniref:UPF0606 protein KIAA1549 n=1 Tax=Trichomycterus rosablanca TaxID=2290929 RepID=UPI002F358D5B
MKAVMHAPPLPEHCQATVLNQGWHMLSLCLITLVSMTTANPAQDWTLLASNMTKQSLEEVPQYQASPSALPSSFFKALAQSSDIYRTFTILPNTEPAKHLSDDHSVYGSASTPPLSYIHSPEPLSGSAISHSQSAGPDASEEPYFTAPKLQTELINPGNQMKPFNPLFPSQNLNIQNDAYPDGYTLNPSHAIFGTLHATSYFVEPTMGPPEDFFPTNTMDVEYGSGDYLETMAYLGTEGDDYSLVTNLPSEMYDFEASNSEFYDTSFPSRVVIPVSTRYLSPTPTSAFPNAEVTIFANGISNITHNSTGTPSVTSTLPTKTTSQEVMTAGSPALPVSPTLTSIPNIYSTIHPTTAHLASILPTNSASLNQSSVANETLDSTWHDSVTIEPSDVLLPDMNSLEYYTIQLTKGDEGLPKESGNQAPSTHTSLNSLSITSTFSVNSDHMPTVMYGEDLQHMDNSWPEESSTDISGFDLFNTTVLDLSGVRPSLANSTLPFEFVSVLTSSMDLSTSPWNTASTPALISTESVSTPGATSMFIPPAVSEEADVVSQSASDIDWFIKSTLPETSFPTPTLISHVFTHTPSASAFPTESTHNASILPVTEMADQGVTESPFSEVTNDEMTTISDFRTNSTSDLNNETTVATPSIITVSPDTGSLPTTLLVTTQTPILETTTVRQYICNITTKPDTYLVRVGFPAGLTAGYAKAKVREILKAEFNRSVELQVVKAPPDFVFRAVSGPVVYTAISVMNALRRFMHTSDSMLSVSPISPVPDLQYHIHSVLQFVPNHIDIHVCTFIDHVENGLTFAFAEVRHRSRKSTNFTVHILNITLSPVSSSQRPRGSVDITFVVQDSLGYILGSEVSSLLRLLSVVEFSYYLGYPVQQIAEPFHYPELNSTHLLRSSWVKTVLLGMMEHRVSDRVFQATMERRFALLLREGLATGQRFKRATSVGNNSLQIVQTTRLEGPDNPLEIIYFVEDANGERLPAVTTANLLNRLDVQHAAILLGYRVQGILAQPFEKQTSSPSETEKTNTWIIVGVVVPVLVVVIIISILYWKLCRTDKLEFQPDTMSTIQQRQKLQAPSVKGFDFAKLHLGQHSKDNLMVIQEPLPLPAPTKEPGTNDNAEASTPKSKGSSTKTSRNRQQRPGQISPSDGDSVGSEPFTEMESPKEISRHSGPSTDSKQPHKAATNGLNGPPPPNDQASSASIFQHVDRMSRSADGANKRLSSKIQLIAMQPMPALPLPNTAPTDKAAENAKMNKEIQVALRQKSEIEHHRNKIRLRAKRKGHYDFPTMDDLMDGLGDAREQDRIYQKAQMQIDKILNPDSRMSPLHTEPRKSREKRSPRQKKKQQINGDLTDADRDRLITTDSDGTYKKYPGVNNIAFVSDPDQGPDTQSPSPTDDVFLSSPPGHIAPPPPYLPPQPSIEEARQQMHSLLDDAFALVSPSSLGPNAGITLPGLGVRGGNASSSSPPAHGPGPCGPSYPALSPFSGRYPELGLPPSTVQGLLHRQGFGSCYPQGEGVGGEQLQPEALYNSRGGYSDELPSSARPRPVGSTTGVHLHHISQVGVSSRVGDSRQPAALNLGPYHEEDFRPANRDPIFEFPPVSVFQNSRNGLREPSAPPVHLDTVGLGYSPSAPPEDSIPPSHSSASLIKAIREELMRLSQKQAAPTGYHS